MKVFKNVFIIIFPILMTLVIIQHMNDNHISIRESWGYFSNNYDLVTSEYIDTINADLQLFSNFNELVVKLPKPQDIEGQNWLQNIWTYVLWFFTFQFRIVMVALVPLEMLFDSLALVFKTIYTFIDAFLYLCGFYSV